MIQVTNDKGEAIMLTNSPKQARQAVASNPGSQMKLVDEY